MIDWTDSNRTAEISNENIATSKEYHKSRIKFGEAKGKLHFLVAKGYDEKTLDIKLSLEKAILLLVSRDPKAKELYKIMVMEEQNYKGLHEVVDSVKTHLFVVKDLIKNRNMEG